MSDIETATLATDIRVLAGRLRRRLAERGSNTLDYTPSQVAVLVRLEKQGPLTVTALASAEGVRPQSMGATVAVLQAAGHIDSAPHPTDGRQTLLSLSDSARTTIEGNRAAKEDWLTQTINSSLTAEEQRQLAIGVALLSRIADTR